jgi:uncharacterized protein (TIGR02246 family)
MTPGIPLVDKDKKSPKQPAFVHAPGTESSPDSGLDQLYQKLQSEMRRPKPSQDAMAAAIEVVHRLAGEIDAEDAVEDTSEDLAGDVSGRLCRACGYRNREGNRFCAMCGLSADSTRVENGETAERQSHEESSLSQGMTAPDPHAERMPASSAAETHHFHHHYHHHYFQAGQETGVVPRHSTDVARDSEKLRSSAILRGESMSRAEAAVRRLTQEWVLACNTKHLDDLLELYVADALVLRSNYPPVRGAAAIREFFFGALDAGLGEVEVDPLRVEVAGDMAYEAGRCKALIPGATGKRREERGKYLWVFARQSNGEWKLASDCWSSDLTLFPAEAEIATGSPAKPLPPRKGV